MAGLGSATRSTGGGNIFMEAWYGVFGVTSPAQEKSEQQRLQDEMMGIPTIGPSSTSSPANPWSNGSTESPAKDDWFDMPSSTESPADRFDHPLGGCV